jgi:integrase/recombinase XerD
MISNTQGTSVISQAELIRPLINAFLSAKRAENISPGTLDFYRKKLLNLDDFCYTQGIKAISQVSPDSLRQFLIYMKDRGSNDGGIHAHFRVVRTFLKWYEKEFEPENWHNPIHKVKAPRVAIEPLEPCNIEDVEKMMKLCGSNLLGRRDKAILLVLLDSGVRASELMAIQLSEIDILSGEVFINKGKGRKSRYVYLGEKSRKAIRQYLRLRDDKSHVLWVGRDGDPLTYWGLVDMLTRRAKQAGVPQPSIHSFRYFFALTSLRNGMDIFSLQKAGGWASMAVMRRYLKQTETDVETAMKKYSPVDNLK